MFWQNFQIPCVFPDRDLFWPFSLFSLCSVSCPIHRSRPYSSAMHLFISHIPIHWPHPYSQTKLLFTRHTLIHQSFTSHAPTPSLSLSMRQGLNGARLAVTSSLQSRREQAMSLTPHPLSLPHTSLKHARFVPKFVLFPFLSPFCFVHIYLCFLLLVMWMGSSASRKSIIIPHNFLKGTNNNIVFLSFNILQIYYQ